MASTIGSSTITSFVTDESGFFRAQAPTATGPSTLSDVVEIDTRSSSQSILGFGAAFTDAACYMISRLEESKRLALLQELLAEDQMAFNVCRIAVGQCDYGRVVYSYDDVADDVELKHFTLDYDRAYILPTLREARQIRPDLYLYSSPWSPPGWMKSSGRMTGGWMRDKYLGVFAQYYLKYLQEYAKEGIKIDGLTPQNEVETDQASKMPACYWSPDQEVEFVRDHLGPLLKQHGMDLKIWLLDHNYDLYHRANVMLDQPGIGEYIDGIAFHGYMGSADMMKKVTEAHPGTNLYWTEGGPMVSAHDYKTDWCYWARIVTEAIENGCKCFTAWNMALDEDGRPNVGPFHCGGVVTIHSTKLEITRSGQYYGVGHFSKAVRRDAVRLESTTTVEGIKQVAFRNPDGSVVLVVTNPGNTRPIAIKAGRTTAEVTLPSNSVTTLTWQD